MRTVWVEFAGGVVEFSDGRARIGGVLVPVRWERDAAAYYPDPVMAQALDFVQRFGGRVVRDEGVETPVPGRIY